MEQSGDSVSDCDEEVILEDREREGQQQMLDGQEHSESDDASEMNDSDLLGCESEVR